MRKEPAFCCEEGISLAREGEAGRDVVGDDIFKVCGGTYTALQVLMTLL